MKGFSQKSFKTLKQVLGLAQSTWQGGYSYQTGWQYVTDEEGETVLHYHIDIDLIWNDMTCEKRDEISTFMASGELRNISFSLSVC